MIFAVLRYKNKIYGFCHSYLTIFSFLSQGLFAVFCKASLAKIMSFFYDLTQSW